MKAAKKFNKKISYNLSKLYNKCISLDDYEEIN